MRPESPADPLAHLRPRIRRTKMRILLHTALWQPIQLLRSEKSQRNWAKSRWGRYPSRVLEGSVWIHATAIGEMRVAVSLARALPATLPLVITTFDPASAQMARDALRDRAEVTSFPVIFSRVMRRFLEHFGPEKLILIEGGELHPLFLLATLRRELPTAIVNGWFSRNQIQRSEIFLPLLGAIDLFGVRHEEDREKLIELGVPAERIHITGDLKFDAAAVEPVPDLERQLREIAGDRPILIAGSTHPREEPAVLDAFEKIGGGQRALLILATRNPRFFQHAEDTLRERKLAYLKRSQLPAPGQRSAVVLLDRIGELAALYRLAVAAFVGGSLVPGGGGQSPLEAARCAVPIAVGPHMNNFRLVADTFDQAHAWQRVAGSDELAGAWSSWMDHPQLARDQGEKAAKLIESHRGALARTVEILQTSLFLGEPES